MKLKYHKIKNIPLEVCTAEQKIAYNLAFSNIAIAEKYYNKCVSEIQKSSIVSDIVNLCMKQWTNSYDYEIRQKKYNVDAIFSALMAGMEKYINEKYHILNSYEEIGKMFPANYL